MIFEIFLWLVAISLAVHGFIKKDQSLLGYFFVAILLYGLSLLAYNSIFGEVQYSHPLDGLSLGAISVWVFSVYVYSMFYLKTENILFIDWRFVTVFPLIYGIGNIAGALFFGYSNSQYITGLLFIVLSITFLIMEKHPKVESFSILSVVTINIVFLGYLGLHWVEYEGEVSQLSNMVIRFGGPIALLFLFFWVYLSKFKIITEKKGSVLLKGFFTLFIASILFHRPEMTTFLNIDKAGSVAKDFLAFGEVGTVLFVAAKSALAYKYIS